jgi:aconitase B
MVSQGIFLKKVDRKAYRKLKSTAAERGVPVYTLLNEAIAAYVESQSLKGSEESAATLEQIDNVTYSRVESDASLKGKWVAIAEGKMVGSSNTKEGAVQLLRQAYGENHFRHGILAKVGEPREEGEWLAGSIQQG